MSDHPAPQCSHLERGSRLFAVSPEFKQEIRVPPPVARYAAATGPEVTRFRPDRLASREYRTPERVLSVMETIVSRSPIVVAAQRGDADAREALARDCVAIAWRVAVRLTGDPDAARDLAQEAGLRCLRALDRFKADRPLAPWVAQIVRNLVRDAARRRRVRRVEPLHRTTDGVILEPADPEPDPEVRASRHQLQRIVWKCLAELDEPQREIIVLRDFEGLSYDEVAHVLGIARGTVMSRLHRARRRLADEVRRRTGGGAS